MERQLKNRTKIFAHTCVRLAVSFPKDDLGRHLSRQLIRCSTSVAANYRAACIAQTKRSFVSKLSIVIEEVDEANFWLEFAKDENLDVDMNELQKLFKESDELTKIFVSSRKTAEQNLANEEQVEYKIEE